MSASSAYPLTKDVGKINLAPQLAVLDATHLDELITHWLAAKAKRVDAKTVRAYGFKLNWFRDWWRCNGPNKAWLLYEQDLWDFEEYLRRVTSEATKKPLSYNSRNDVLRRLRQALWWAWTKQITDRDYSKWVPAPEGGTPERTAARVEQLLAVMDAGARSPYPERDQAMLAIMIGMGLRASEVASLLREEVQLRPDLSGIAKVHGKRTRAKKLGERTVGIDSATGRFIIAHIDKLGYPSGPLFRAADGHRLGYITVYRVTKDAIKAAGLTSMIQGCHDLRRAFSTYFARTKNDAQSADILRRQMGHAKFWQTSEYNLLDGEDLRENMISPLAEIAAQDPY